MVIDTDKLGLSLPIVETDKYKGREVNPKGLIGGYYFNSRNTPTCPCLAKYQKVDAGNTCKKCGETILINRRAKVVSNNYFLSQFAFYQVRSKSAMREFSYIEMNKLDSKKEMYDYFLNFISEFMDEAKMELLRKFDPNAMITKTIVIVDLKYREDDTRFKKINPINVKYQIIIKLIEQLNLVEDESVLNILMQVLQKHYYDLTELSSSSVFALEQDLEEFSGRLSLLAQPLDLPFTEIGMYWKVFWAMYELPIVRLIKIKRKTNTLVAYGIYRDLTYESELLHEIFAEIREETLVLTNRVPSLKVHSLIASKMGRLLEYHALELPQVYFALIAGDIDGDNKALFAIFSKEALEEAVKLSILGIPNDIFSAYAYHNQGNNMRGKDAFGKFQLENKGDDNE